MMQVLKLHQIASQGANPLVQQLSDYQLFCKGENSLIQQVTENQVESGACTACDPYWDDVVLLMHGDSFTDVSSSNVTILNNSATTSGGYFVGDNNGYFETTDNSADFVLFSVDNTIEFSIYRTAEYASGAVIGKLRNNAGGSLGAGAWLITLTNGDFFNFQANSVNTIHTAVPSHGAWHHVAFSYIKSTGVLSYYLDGTFITSGVISTSWVDTEEHVGIMAEDCSGGVPRLGYGVGDVYLKNLRITKGVARYTSNFTPPTAAFAEASC